MSNESLIAKVQMSGDRTAGLGEGLSHNTPLAVLLKLERKQCYKMCCFRRASSQQGSLQGECLV